MRQAIAHRHTQQMRAFDTRLAQSCEIEALLSGKTNVAGAGVWLAAWRGRYGRCMKKMPRPLLWGQGGAGSP